MTRKTSHYDPKTGTTTEIEVVEIIDIHEKPTTVTLADGTILRVKVDVLEVGRIPGKQDPEGNPAYSVKSGTIVNVLSSGASTKSRGH